MLAVQQTFTQADFDQFITGLKYPPNRFQLPVLQSVASGSGNITIDAKAGSGKTSLLKMIASLLKAIGIDPADVLFQAFNKSIEMELNEQLPPGFTAKTSHALGLAICREYLAAKGVKLGKASDKKYNDIAKEVAERLHPGEDEKDERFKAMLKFKKLLGMVMANDTDPRDEEAVYAIADHYNIEDVTRNMVRAIPGAIDRAIEKFERFGELDFIDMIYMPVKLKLEPSQKFKWVLTDEGQDLNSLQQEISAKFLHPEGRIVVVGDPKQSLYAFAGADVEAFWNLQKRFNSQILQLNICYRCPTSHIALAQSLVPDIEAAPGAIEGTIEYKHLHKDLTQMKSGSMVICRLNAPLVSAYFQFIAAEKPAIIIGRNMSKNLIDILDKVAERDNFRYRDIGRHLEDHFQAEKARLEKRPNTESKIAELADSIECLQVCATNFNCDDLACFKQKLEALFVDTTDKKYDPKKVVTLCTVHRAKGLEADHIGIIYQRPKGSNGSLEWKDLMPLTWAKQKRWEHEQELNIKYVALTRAKQTLTIFGGYQPGDTPDITSNGTPMFNDFDFDSEEEEPIDEETPQGVLTTPENAELADERLAKAHGLLLKCAKSLNSALDAGNSVAERYHLEDAERHGKDFQVALSQSYADHLSKWVEILGEERGNILTWNDVHAQTYLTLDGKRDIEDTLKHVLEVLNAMSKQPTEAPTMAQIADALYTPVIDDKSQADEAAPTNPPTTWQGLLESGTKIDGVTTVTFDAEASLNAQTEINSPVDESPEPQTVTAAAEVTTTPAVDKIPTEPTAWAKWMLDHKDKVVILDTETTDLPTNLKNFEIIQLSIIEPDGNVLFNKHILPRVSTITPGAERVHGINHNMLAGHAQHLDTHFAEIVQAIEGKHILAYNAPFDEEALENSMRFSNHGMFPVAGWHCVMRMYAQHNPNKAKFSGKKGGWWTLSEAVVQERIAGDFQAHDALEDVRMTLALIQKMATNDPNKWKNPYGFDYNEAVRVKASGKVVQVVKTLDSSEIMLTDPADETYRITMKATAVERIHQEPQPAPTVVEPQPVEVPVVTETTPEPEQPTDSTAAVTAGPNAPHLDPFERIKELFEKRLTLEQAIEFRDLLNEIIDEKQAELAEVTP